MASLIQTTVSRLSTLLTPVRQYLTTRTLIILLLLTNLKSLPLAWHLRLLRRFFANLYTPSAVTHALHLHATDPTGRTPHPIFQSVSMHTHAPLYETDYNLHKSNSTYFSDLDESRTALATRLLGPGLRAGDKTLERQGHKGRVGVMLGAVHCSFHREIRPYERYEVRSRVLGWDRKWLVIGTFLVREGKKGKEDTLLASALSKYVVKKGRFTVAPEHCLRVAGWLPERPERAAGVGEDGVEGSAVLVPSAADTGADTEAQGTPSGLNAPVEMATGVEAVVERLQRVKTGEEERDPVGAAAKEPAEEKGPWGWERIERERARGLKIAEAWLGLDGALKDEYQLEQESGV